MIILRYINRQLLQTTAALTLILLVVAVMGRLLQYLTQASEGKIEPQALLLLLAWRLPNFIQLILPLALLLSILLVYGRMYADSEMSVLRACGFSPVRLLGLTMLTTGGVAIAVAWLALSLTPQSLIKIDTLLAAQKNLNEFDLMVPGLFQNLGQSERTSYAQGITEAGMQNIFVYEANTNRMIYAQSATPLEDAAGARFMVFENGSMTEGNMGSADFSLTTFDELGFRLPPRELNFAPILEERGMTNQQLLVGGQASQLAELQWRISLIILLPALALLAVPLSRVSPREGRFARLIPALLIYIAYFGLLLVSRDLLEKETIPAWFGLWWVHLVFFIAGWLMFTERKFRFVSSRALNRHG
ncbi:MAG: LPS export ABC transporter permease LptF [Pseudohongiellaceae bacterium]